MPLTPQPIITEHGDSATPGLVCAILIKTDKEKAMQFIVAPQVQLAARTGGLAGFSASSQQ